MLEVDAVASADLNDAARQAGEELTAQLVLATAAIAPAEAVKEPSEEWIVDVLTHFLSGRYPPGLGFARAAGRTPADALRPRLDTPLLFPSPDTNVLNLNDFRNRIWAPAIEANGVRAPARIYDLRSTFASNAPAAGITVFEPARVMGTSVEMIERHYGTLLDGSGASMAQRLPGSRPTRTGTQFAR